MTRTAHFVIAFVLCGAGSVTAQDERPKKGEPQAAPPAQVSAPTAAPPNDLWANAIFLVAPASVSGSNREATGDAAASCPTASPSAPGMWYRVVGKGQPITATTCAFFNFDTVVSVYTDAGMTCAAGNDDACGVGSSITWTGLDGVDYYILVRGYSGAVGEFTLDVTGVTPVELHSVTIR